MYTNIKLGTDFYPKIIFPENLHNIHIDKISVNHPQKPQKPNLPTKPDSNFIDQLLAFFACAVSGISILYCVAQLFDKNPGVGLVGGWVSIVAFMFFRKQLIEIKKNAEAATVSYNNNVVKYKNDIYEYENILLLDYEGKVVRHNQLMKNLEDEKFRIQFKRKKSIEYLIDNAKKPSFFNGKAPKKGVTEMFFIRYMNSYFKGKIQILSNYTILFEDYYFNQNQMIYLPDIVIYIKEINLTIDVEIDEPYSADSLEPIHYLGSKDDKRNDFFTYFGWIVIRFSEEQIIKNPYCCCHVIIEVINQYYPIYKFPDALDRLELSPAWTYNEAKQMAAINYRKQYLSMSASEQL